VAQTSWINLMIDSNAGDPARKGQHTVLGGTQGQGGATFSWDPTQVTNANIANSILDTIKQRLIGGQGLK
jgi:hypothetical protein